MFRKNNGHIDIFDAEYFESCLPKNAKTKEPLWTRQIDKSEYQYLISMNDPNGVMIVLRSSINPVTDISEETGEDSIRMWLVDKDRLPLGHKLNMYTTRKAGWEKRMWTKFSALRRLRKQVGNCAFCSRPRKVYKVKKRSSGHFGEFFARCNCKENSPLIWLNSIP